MTLYGRVTGIEEVEDENYHFPIKKVDFKPLYMLKDEKNDLVSIYTSAHGKLGSLCGDFSYKKGRSYLVYASEHDGKLRTTNMCSRNKGGPLGFIEFLYLQKYSLLLTFISMLTIRSYNDWIKRKKIDY